MDIDVVRSELMGTMIPLMPRGWPLSTLSGQRRKTHSRYSELHVSEEKEHFLTPRVTPS